MTKAEKNKTEGKMDKLKGEAKDKYGKLTDDKKKQASGKADKLKGKMKEKVGEFQEKNRNKNDERP